MGLSLKEPINGAADRGNYNYLLRIKDELGFQSTFLPFQGDFLGGKV